MSDQTTLLIIDDNPVDRTLIQRLLDRETQRRYTYYGAELANTALDMLAATSVDCVLLDYRLPDSDGLEMLAELGGGETGLTLTPVVMLTGVGSEQVAVRALQAGAMDYLVKERLSGPRLAQVIDDAIRRHQVRAGLHARQRTLEKHALELERRVSALQERLAEELGRAELVAALEAERASLAQRVADRTAELRATNEELARAGRLKDEFLANMSHELRTPLNTILGWSELLLEQIAGPLTEKQQQWVRNIAESGQNLLALINDILDLSKIEARGIELALAATDVELVCQQSRQLIVERAMRKGIRLTTTIDPRVASIQADERRLRQILINLLTNAVKFTPEHGQVGIEVQGDVERQAVTFTVWDTGIGIAPEDQRRLFQPFVQIDGALNRAHAGTGLGLALVLRLTELHGGSVALSSRPGAGSRFSVTLPWTPSAASADRSPALAAPAPQGSAGAPAMLTQPVILLAEDHEQTREVVKDWLGAAGYAVIVARNGEEAVALATEQRPALILMDIQMPLVDGLEATRRLRAAGLSDTPIIALTALAMPGDRERCLEAGATDYLAKPVSLRGLQSAVAELLRKAGGSQPT